MNTHISMNRSKKSTKQILNYMWLSEDKLKSTLNTINKNLNKITSQI